MSHMSHPTFRNQYGESINPLLYNRLQSGCGFGYGRPLPARGFAQSAVIADRTSLIARSSPRVYPCPGSMTMAPQTNLTPPECQCIECFRQRHAFDISAYLHDQAYWCDHSCDAKNKDKFPFKTKDVTIRGKAFSFRASYLVEVPKLEKELVSFMEKKTQEEVPDRVVNMLVSFINRERYVNDDPLDEVTLNILASNVGAKSVVEHSMDQLKKLEKNIDVTNIVDIICTIMESSGVIDKLTDWLKDILCEESGCQLRFIWEVMDLPEYNKKIYRPNPGLHFRLEVMTGLRVEPDKPKTRVL
ncbi:uncharacterized protein PAC_07129 [Phialocephala subalpina]|uniref:Uncharacterized protein n=1 Tax=Phialocephala subalpina TaxID=576137 RepID=A0A1L7WWU9_9HELO|nr:uncharacterized protein PAC_07129 [Phialocephala subalpina]